jgi:diguanylate cyclase (GGDEF)-like protein
MLDTFAFNPRTAWVMAAAMMLLNGGVLGLMHKALDEEVRPSAFYWRTGTLLSAGGCILQAVQDLLPLEMILALSNFMFALGISCYWKSLSLFYSKQPSVWIWAPPVILAALIYYYSGIHPNLGARIVIGSLVAAWLTAGCAYVLFRYGNHERMVSRNVLMAIALFVSFIMLLRAFGAALNPPKVGNLLEIQTWTFMLILIFIAFLPIIGTTAFLLMCSERYQIRWRSAASTDYLTNLNNRRTISLIAEQAFENARKNNQPLSIGVLDVDHFKQINDNYGHDAGDLALKQVANLLLNNMHKANIGRMGGEEFMLLWEDADRNHATNESNKILSQLKGLAISYQQATLQLTASIGVATIEASDADFDHLLQRADKALYIAKAMGRDRVVLA